MKKTVSIALRVSGVLLVVYILVFQVRYRDRYAVGDGEDVAGRVETVGGAEVFAPADGGPPMPLPADWRAHEAVRPGLFTIVAESDKLLLALFVLFFGPVTLISITRWWRLLREIGIPIRFWDAFRLTFLGSFFNSVVPGLTGGDVVKAVYVAKRAPGVRMKAFMSVLVDRLLGLFALGVLAGAVLLPWAGDPRFRPAAAVVYLFLGIAAPIGVAFLSQRIRRLVHLEALIRRLPFSTILLEIDQAVFIYRKHVPAVLAALLLSLLNHACLVVMALGMGRAIGIDAPPSHFFILVPVSMMMASVPLLPGGWGVRETAFVAFFGLVGVAATKAFALSVLIGLTQLAWSLLGGVFFLTEGGRTIRREAEELARGVEAEVQEAELSP